MRKADKLRASLKTSAAAKVPPLTPDGLVKLLRRGRRTTKELCEAFGAKSRVVEGTLAQLQDSGALIYLFGDKWGLGIQPANEECKYPFVSTKDNKFKFGFSSDQHIGSKYFRPDVLQELYKRFIDAGCDRVFNGGNWIDGEARFNMHDLEVHGMDNQINRMIEDFPTGIDTYAVAGDDHEGWYAQREGIDIGKHAEHIMRSAGRTDWFNLGYMESFVPLVNKNTKKTAQLLVMHPGGGSAYADSYQPQKLMESLDGGEKPAAALIGHYHKLGLYLIRNVWCLQSGTTQDQTPFMRKKRIKAHIGGGICELEQDPKTGAIISCTVQLIQFFNRGYYNDRWSHSGKVTLPVRSVVET